jgi:AcrR family transcriptional regulator
MYDLKKVNEMPKVTDAHVEARRTQILQAACKCFSRSGVHRTTIRDICQEAGLSTGALYGYFKSKDEIIEAMAEVGRQNTRAFFEAARTAEVSTRALSQMLGAGVGFLNSQEARESTRLDLRLWGEGLHTPRIRELFLQAFANVTEPFAEAVRDGQARGEIDARLDPQGAARLFAAVCLGFTVQKAMDPEADIGNCTEVISALLDGTFTVQRSKQ